MWFVCFQTFLTSISLSAIATNGMVQSMWVLSIAHYSEIESTWVLCELPPVVADESFCRRPVNQNTPSGGMLVRWMWLASIPLAVIDRLSENVDLQFGEMWYRQQRSATFVGKCEEGVSGGFRGGGWMNEWMDESLFPQHRNNDNEKSAQRDASTARWL